MKKVVICFLLMGIMTMLLTAVRLCGRGGRIARGNTKGLWIC